MHGFKITWVLLISSALQERNKPISRRRLSASSVLCRFIRSAHYRVNIEIHNLILPLPRGCNRTGRAHTKRIMVQALLKIYLLPSVQESLDAVQFSKRE